MNAKKAVAFSVATVIFLGGIIILRIHSQTAYEKKAETDKPVTVSVTTVRYGAITDKISVTGALEGIHEAEIISETSGKIVGIDADIDSWLKAGGHIARVENDLQEISLEQSRAQTAAARANSDKAQSDLARIASLYVQKAVSESQMENAELAAKAALAQLRGAQAAEKLAQKQFDDTILRSSISGRLAQKYINIGKMVSPGMKVATVVDDSRMKLIVGVPEENVSSVCNGDRAEITVDAVPGVVFRGKVRSIALKADPMTRTFQLEIDFPNDRARSVKSGMFARAEITISVSDSQLVIPSAALLESGVSTHDVYVVKGSRVSRKTVSIGARNDSLVTVSSGLAQGDTIVTFGQPNLKDGTLVRYKPSE